MHKPVLLPGCCSSEMSPGTFHVIMFGNLLLIPNAPFGVVKVG